MTKAKLPRISGAQLQKALQKAGFKKVSQKGSHLKMKHPDGRIAIIPMHKGARHRNAAQRPAAVEADGAATARAAEVAALDPHAGVKQWAATP